MLEENERLSRENQELQVALSRQEFNDKIMYRQWKEIKETLSEKERELEEVKRRLTRPVLSLTAISVLCIATMLLGAFASYFFLSGKAENQSPPKLITTSTVTDTLAHNSKKQTKIHPEAPGLPGKKDSLKPKENVAISKTPPSAGNQKQAPELQVNNSTASASSLPGNIQGETGNNLGEYGVKSKAYFHDGPDENTRRRAFIVHWNKATLKAIDDQNGFIYVVFTNHLGQTSKGWLNKNDLKRIDDE